MKKSRPCGCAPCRRDRPGAGQRMAQGKTFYWISHGSPADPVWTYYLAGAEQWAAATGNQVNTSFHNGDVPSQQEAVRAAIAAGAAGIAVASPQEGALVELARESTERNIPIIAFNSNDETADFLAFVGGEQLPGGRRDGAVRPRPRSGEGRGFRLDAGRGARRNVRRRSGKGYRERLRAARHHLGGDRGDAGPGGDHRADERLPDRQQGQGSTSIFPLGDLVTGSIKRVFDQVGIEPGAIPVDRLGQLARHGQ
jgi:simple sugar transport system substrate-binding protein